jgi:hypothetical protein
MYNVSVLNLVLLCVLLATLEITLADPEISKRGGPLQKGGRAPHEIAKTIDVFWVSNLEFY